MRADLSRTALALALVVVLGSSANAQQRRRTRGPATAPKSPPRIVAEWAGQGREDRVGLGPSVGPDGIRDAKIVVSNLTRGVGISGIVVKGPGGAEWHSGLNPLAKNSAELILRGDDPTRGDFFFAHDRDLKGQTLSLTVYYADASVHATKVVAGAFDPKASTPRPKLGPAPLIKLDSRWIGQDGDDKVGPGDVHVALDGLPRLPLVAACLSNSQRGCWSARLSDRAPYHEPPGAVPMAVVRGADPARADLHFPPLRDETGGTMTLRLVFEGGRAAVARFPGGKADPGLRASSWPSKVEAKARPGSDLQAMAGSAGRILLEPGTYRLTRPLVLDRPIAIVGSPGATLEFSQSAGDPTWPAAVKIHSGHTHLEGFAIRFATPIRWTPGVQGGPAVVGCTDSTDPGPGDLKADLTFRNLDLEGPPASTSWEESPRLIRLDHAVCGVVEANRLKGGSVEFEGGPWRIVGNRHEGTPENTNTQAVFSAHHPHDLVVKDNKARRAGGRTKTFRFLVLVQSGCDDLVEGNDIEGLGPRDDDTTPGDNAPEIILTEAYRLHFEGRPSAVSSDGLVMELPVLQGGTPSTGDAVAILSGSSAGQWRTIAQPLGPTTFLLNEPLPAGAGEAFVSVATGFNRTTIRKNRIDSRGASGSGNLVLVGNLFGLNVSENHLLGGGGAFKITAAPTEQPIHWGWSHAPLMGATIEGNLIEDSVHGGTLSVEHSQAIKTNRGRVYASVKLKDNELRWSPDFAARHARGSAPPPGIMIGDEGSIDPSEIRIEESGTRAGGHAAIGLKVRAARINGKEIRNQALRLPTEPSSARSDGEVPRR